MVRIGKIILGLIIGLILGFIITIRSIKIENIEKDKITINIFNHNFEYGFNYGK